MLSFSLGVSRMNRIRIESIRGHNEVVWTCPQDGMARQSLQIFPPLKHWQKRPGRREAWGEARRRDFVDGAKEDMSVRKEDGVKRKRVIGCADARREELEEEEEGERGITQEGTWKNMDLDVKVSLHFHETTN